MIVLECKQTTFCDVDDTLIMWSATQEELDNHGVEITCPGGYAIIDGELIPSPPFTGIYLPYAPHVEQLKKHKARGHTVVVWSAGGWDWAAAAVKALGLEPYVDLVISKPTWCYDDKKPEDYMPPSSFIKEKK